MTDVNDTERMSQRNETETKGPTVDRRQFMQTSGVAAGILGLGNMASRPALAGRSETPAPSEGMISVLMMGGPTGGSHNAPARQVQLTEFLLNRGIEVVYTDRLDDLKSDTLHRYDAWIMFDNRSGLTEHQESSIIEFVEGGGGFVPIHSASACFTESEAYINLVGGQFEDHGYGTMSTTYEQPDHPILSTLDPLTSEDETYRHTNLNDDINVLAYGDFPDYGENEEPEPWSWTRTQGDGRVFYTAWGHGRNTWQEDGFKDLIENAIRWVTGNEDTIAEDTRVLDDLQFTEADIPYYPPPEGGILPETVPERVGEGTDWNRMQQALNPQGTINRSILPEGFSLEPFLVEGVLPEEAQGNILDMKFDAQGRVWIAVTRDYPNDLGQGRDKIVICEDTDGDGQADDFTIFAEDLSIPASMVLVEDGVLVANLHDPSEMGQLLRIRDTDGDDRADERNVLFEGYENSDTHAGPNELIRGIDNWIWGQVGYAGFNGAVAGEQREFSSAIYRFKYDDDCGEVTDFEIAGQLPGNQAGVGFNEAGLVFASAATTGRPSNYLPIPHSYYELIDGTQPTDFGPASDTNRFLPATLRVRQVDHHGGYTAASGHTIYTAREYPEKYWNNTGFVADGTGNLLGTFYLHQDGADYNTHNAHNMVGATDAWFSPTYSDVGPSGMLWFIDWYNYIFQHNPTPEGFETGPGNAYVNELRDHSSARLFRITYGDATGYQPADLSGACPLDLVDALSDDNMFWRLKAQRMLIERGELDVVPDLVQLIENESIDELGLAPGAIHALWTLEGLGAFDPEVGDDVAIDAAVGALTSRSAAVRLNAQRALPKTARVRDAILEKGLLNDDDKRVATWALLVLAEMPESDAAGTAVYQMISAEPNYEESILVDAASIAGAQHADGFIAAYEANEEVDAEKPDPNELPNLIANPGMEEPSDEVPSGSAQRPANWEEITYGGTAEFVYSSDVARTGENSVRIGSSEGADASWSQFVQLEANSEYRFRAWVRTSDDFRASEEGSAEPGGAYGVTIDVHSFGEESITDYYAEPVEGWQLLETTFETGSTPPEVQLNLLFGGWGNAFGTVWFDDVELKKVGGFGSGLRTVYDRVTTHVQTPAGGNGDSGTDDSEAIDPSTTIELVAESNEAWAGVVPSSIEGEENPTLTLEADAEYTLTWTNGNGAPHNFEIVDDDDEVLQDVSTETLSAEGESQTVTFTATAEVAEYVCRIHQMRMRGDVEIVSQNGD